MSIRSFFGFGKGRKSQSQSSKRSLRMEALEERALLSAAPLSTSEYADLRAEYAEFYLPPNMNDLNVITLDLAQGDGLSQLKSAISTAETTEKSDLIVVRTSDTANTLTYTAAGDELYISSFGSITIVGLGTKSLTLNANQKCRVISISGYSTANLGGMTISGGYANASLRDSSWGSGIYNEGSLKVSNVVISNNTTISDNTYDRHGAGMFNKGTLIITNSLISNNKGTGIVNNGSLTVSYSAISNNKSFHAGIVSSGTLILNHSTISDNATSDNVSPQGAGHGCGLSIETGTATINYCKISGNIADSGGAGIYNGGNLTISNSEISGNISSGTNIMSATGGGGIYTAGPTKIINCTITGNKAKGYVPYGGGIHIGSDKPVLIYNSIIHSNTADEGNDIYCFDDLAYYNGSGPHVYGFNNLTSFTDWTEGTGNLEYDSSNPLFVDVANGDYHLIEGSQAIDKGNNGQLFDAYGAAFVYDLDNNPRIMNGTVDLGAYEYYTLEALSAPSLSAEATGTDCITVTVGSVANASGYRIEYSTSADFANAVSQNVIAGSTDITGLNANTTYYFRTFAIGTGDYSDSDYSDMASATTLAEPVTADAKVNARIVFQDSLKDVDTSSSLPEGISSIRAGKTVYAEIWIKNVDDADPGIIGGYLNMLYDNAALTVGEVTYGTVFSTLTSNPDVGTAGLIDLIGGGAAQGVLDKGDDEWVRLATVSFDADAEGLTTVSLAAPNDYRDNITRVGGVILTNNQIDFGSAILEVTAACPMDIDGDGYIGMSDYGLLSSAWRSSPGKDNWNPACDIDGDGYVGMSDYAFLSSNWRKYADDPSLVYPTASASPAAAVSEDNFIEMNNTAAFEADETAVSTKTASDVNDSMFSINFGESNTAASELSNPVFEIQNNELLGSQLESSPLPTNTAQVLPENNVESSLKLQQAHSAALLDLYDNQTNTQTVNRLSVKEVDEVLYENDEFDFLYDESDGKSSENDFVLSLFTDELEEVL